jgi:hypothetical protein
MSDSENAGLYLLWIDNGTEGWSFRSYDGLQAALDAIQSGVTYGQKFMLTKRLALTAVEARFPHDHP